MEFLKQSKQNQRSIERFVIIFYSLYTINLCFGIVRRNADTWIIVIMLAMLSVGWGMFLGRYRNFRVRSAVTAVCIQLTVVLYATNIEDVSAALPTFMVMAVLVAFYGFVDFLWITCAALFFIAFYHGVIADTFQAASGEELSKLVFQFGNIVCLEVALAVWLKNRMNVNEQVSEIIEALMDAEQSKDDFLSNVSHEIRTPVNTICGMSEMALREHDLAKMREEVFDIRDAGHNLMSLVSDILDFSQLQQGKMNLEEEAYNITSTINDIINMSMARKGEKPIELIVDCSADIPRGLLGDEKKIRRVIMNLVDNAIKFTNEGGVIVGIYVRKEDYGVNLCVSVKDTGIGIGEESLEKLFESFSQVDTRRNRQEGGMGLGLAISRELVQKMGGTITVRSRLGKGSIFRFVIPQKVLDEKMIGQVENREKLNVAAYFDMEQFDMMAIRDEYTKIIVNMAEQLHVKCHVCRNLKELKRRNRSDVFSHIFISLEEYQEDEAYFNELAKSAKVAVVIERLHEKYISSPNIIRLYKPFYVLPVASILNGSSGSEGGMQMVRPGKFTAPGVHVLVVDDNRMNIRVVEGLLKEYQIKVTYATSGREALEVIERMCYDFVFMDHMMPEMDGIETMHHIREKVGSYYQHIPIIALTANAAPGNREMFLEEGFNDFVAKPIEVSVLERVLRRNLPEERLVFVAKEKKGSDRASEDEAIEEYCEGEAYGEDGYGNIGEEKAAEAEKRDDKAPQADEVLIVGDLDVSQGLLFCGGEKQYLGILQACLEDGRRNRELLDSLYHKQDWKNYTINVHALKSTMKSIGAIPLSEKAKELEMAGKQGDTGYILENHSAMLDEYQRVLEELAQCSRLHVPEDSTRAVDDQPVQDAAASQEGRQPGEVSVLPELSEEAFDELIAEFEDAMYGLDGEQMLAVLSRMQEYQYCQVPLGEELSPVRKKIEMSDFMSAVDAVSGIRDSLRDRGRGGTKDV